LIRRYEGGRYFKACFLHSPVVSLNKKLYSIWPFSITYIHVYTCTILPQVSSLQSSGYGKNGFLKHFWVGYLSVESIEGGDAAPDGRRPSEGMQDMLVWNMIQKL